jgi:SanA protein
MPLLASLARALRRRRALFAGLGLLVLADAAWTLIALPASERDRERAVADLPDEGPTALVLACTLDRRGRPNRMLEQRLGKALELYQQGKARRLLVSGYDREPRAMRRWLEQRGVPPAAIVADFSARRTYDSLQRAASVFGLRRLLIVTSDFHLPRALWLSSLLGIDAQGVPASTAGFSWRVRASLGAREYAARNRAVIDAWFPPQMREGPHDPLRPEE